ncbi:MAG: type II toxin-antitoxin system HicA family toxin [Bdellovibrionales bacterium]|nr:type II toxin-antitoxin system HicA family toxin [Bdellovibrionales bacterium]
MPLSGREMLQRYLKSGWQKLRQKGSHVIVRKGKKTQVIPMHDELKKGLENKLLKDLAKDVD